MKKAIVLSILTLVTLFIVGISKGIGSTSIVLRFSTHLSVRDPIVVAMVEGLERIERLSNGKVKVEKYFDGTLISAKDSWEELLRGTADIVNISAHTSPGEKVLPLHLLLGEAWIGVKDMTTQLKIQKQLVNEFPELAKEWSQVKAFCFLGVPTLYILTKKEIKNLTDLKGMQIRGLGAWPKYTLEKLGASLVAIPSPEIYMALQKGVLHGVINDLSTLLTLKLAEVVSYALDCGGVLAGLNNRMCINLNTWNKLPPEIQKLFEETAEWIEKRYIEIRMESTRQALDLAKKHNVTLISLPADELRKFHDLLREEAYIKAKTLDQRGLPATKILQRQQELIRTSL